MRNSSLPESLRLSGQTEGLSVSKPRSPSVCLSQQTNNKDKKVYSHISFHSAARPRTDTNFDQWVK